MNVFIMEKIKNIEEALALFEKNAIIYGNTSVSGNYRICNKAYDVIIKCIDFLKEENKIDILLSMLEHNNISVKYLAACFLLPIYTKESKKALKWIKKNDDGMIGFHAEITLDEWRKEKWTKFFKKLWSFN